MENENHSRRSFLSKLWIVLGAVAFAELIAVIVSFFKPRQTLVTAEDQDAVIVAGPADNFEPGSVSAFIRGKFYLARLEDGGFLAMSRTCTHLGCTVPWVSSENKFVCPCHSSAFDIRGEVISPPAPRALDLHPVTIENNVLKVDTSKRKKRARYDANQAVYVKST